MTLELTKLNQSAELEHSSVESTSAKLYREAQLLLGGMAQGTLESAADGMSAEKWTRTAASFALAAGLTLAMRRPGLLGNMARGAGTVGALNFAADLSNTRRLEALGNAFQDNWNSAANFDSNYSVVKKQLGQVGFDTMLGLAGGAAGAGLAWRYGIKPLPEIIKTPVENKVTAGTAAMPARPATVSFDSLKAAGESGTAAGAERSALAAFEPSSVKTEPLNVFSRSNEPLGKALSNFAHTPFELDGVRYASIEAFYQGLKYMDPVKRAEIAPLYGSYAKSAGNKAPGIKETSYMGEKITLGSPEHHALMERAIKAKIEQTQSIKDGLLESGERPIVHDTGRGMSTTRKSNFPDHVFADMLAKIRGDLASAGQGTRSGTFNAAALEAIEVKGGKSELVKPATRDTVSGAEQITISGGTQGDAPLATVSDALRKISNPRLQEFHNLEDYALAFEGFDRKVSKVLGGGSDSVVLKLEDGNVIKLTTRDLPADLGKRVFDLPVIEQGSRPIDGRQINYFVQPFANKAKPVDLHAVGESIKASGYHFDEPFLNQIGVHNGRPWLLDPFAVTRK